MELYFNPYPSSAKTREESIRLAVRTMDALLRLKKEYNDLSLKSSQAAGDLPPSNFILFRKADNGFSLSDVIHKTTGKEHDMLLLLLIFFSKGKIIKDSELLNVEDWIVSAVDAPAPVLELAAKNKAIALTIPTEAEWCDDPLGFKGREDKLHNLWGQENISAIIKHCQYSIKNSPERFSVRFDAVFCHNALNSAPDFTLWDDYGFFQKMEICKEKYYKADKYNLKHTKGGERTKFGALLELKANSSGYRIFFVHRKNYSPEILVGGFYKKGTGDDRKAQGIAIDNAKRNIDKYSGD
jgi:hypothetical protein